MLQIQLDNPGYNPSALKAIRIMKVAVTNIVYFLIPVKIVIANSTWDFGAYHIDNWGTVVQAVACPFHKQRSRDGPSHLAHSFVEKIILFR